MRGKPLQRILRLSEGRITPAGAGKTQVKYVHPLHLADHPRRCGENKHLFFRHVGSVGSPPQVRGKQWRNKKMTSIERITPAGAGKTPLNRKLLIYSEDHPRRCGENDTRRNCGRKSPGSPPQVRGKLCEEIGCQCAHGITPAGAGKTVWKAASGRVHWDHPRRCGENWAFAPVAACMIGSPPQVRGKRQLK